MNIYWSPSIEIGICSIVICWLGIYYLDKLDYMQPIKRSFIISFCGISSFIVFVIAHILALNMFRSSGYDSQTMQLIKSLVIFSIFYLVVIFLRIIIRVNYKVIVFITIMLIVVWTINSILFNSGLPPYR